MNAQLAAAQAQLRALKDSLGTGSAHRQQAEALAAENRRLQVRHWFSVFYCCCFFMVCCLLRNRQEQ